ncbi:hypothetical protein D3C76_1497870 [compost metagenome]
MLSPTLAAVAVVVFFTLTAGLVTGVVVSQSAAVVQVGLSVPVATTLLTTLLMASAPTVAMYFTS